MEKEKFYINIYRATDSFLYLPAYIAENLKILQTELDSIEKYCGKYEFVVNFVKLESKKGDEEAIRMMLKDVGTNTVAIAIGSPVAFFKSDMEKDLIQNIRVVGAMIDKSTFWAVDHKNVSCDEIGMLKGKFSRVIHPNENYITGYYLGKKTRRLAKINDGALVDFGTEIAELKQCNVGTSEAIAITADIATLAKEISCDNPKLHINHKFSISEKKFLTTGIITAIKFCEEFPDIIERIIESIQKSIVILYSSRETAEKICTEVATSKFKDQFCEPNTQTKSISKIVEMMYEEKFYPADLNISKECWDKAIDALAKTDQWEDEYKNDILAHSFYEYVVNKFVLNSEKSIADQFGIDLETFESELRPMKEKLTNLEQKLGEKDKEIEKKIEELGEKNGEKDKEIEKKIAELGEKDKEIEKKNAELREKDKEIEKKNAEIERLSRFKNFMRKIWACLKRHFAVLMCLVIILGVIIANYIWKFITFIDSGIINLIGIVIAAVSFIFDHNKKKQT